MSNNFALAIPEAGIIAVEPRPIPEPGPGEVLIRTRYTLISGGTELTVLSGASTGEAWRRFAPPQDSIGYSHVGEVVGIGATVDPSWVGKRVASLCPHAAYVTIAVSPIPGQRSGIVEIPCVVSDQVATLAPLAAFASNAIRRGGLVFGESVAVVGLGLLGQLCTRLCAFAGARPVFGINRSPERLRWLRGAHGIASPPGARPAAIRAANGGELVDLAIEASGYPQAIAETLQLVRTQGRLVVLSSPRGDSQLDLHDLCVWPSVTIIGAHMRSHPQVASLDRPWTLHRHMRLFLELVAAGDLVADDLISDVIPAQRARDAYALLADRRERVPMGVCLDWAAA